MELEFDPAAIDGTAQKKTAYPTEIGNTHQAEKTAHAYCLSNEATEHPESNDPGIQSSVISVIPVVTAKPP